MKSSNSIRQPLISEDVLIPRWIAVSARLRTDLWLTPGTSTLLQSLSIIVYIAMIILSERELWYLFLSKVIHTKPKSCLWLLSSCHLNYWIAMKTYTNYLNTFVRAERIFEYSKLVFVWALLYSKKCWVKLNQNLEIFAKYIGVLVQ